MAIKKIMFHDQAIATNVSKTSDLTNDSGFISSESDPVFDNWCGDMTDYDPETTDSAFVVDRITFTYSAISSGGNSGTITKSISKKGYIPVAVVGFRTGNSNAVPIRLRLDNKSWASTLPTGSCNFEILLRAVGSVSAGSGDADILWVKE